MIPKLMSAFCSFEVIVCPLQRFLVGGMLAISVLLLYLIALSVNTGQTCELFFPSEAALTQLYGTV